MSERIKMNSKNLQEKFPEVYESLFSRCNIVVSAPCVFHWAGEYAMNFGGLSLSQKLPFRVYIGIEMTGKKGEIQLGDFMSFIQSNGCFTNNSYSSQKEYYNIKFLEDFKKEVMELNDGNKDFDGFLIHSLFEGPRNVGLNTGSAFLLAAFTAVTLLYKKITLADYNKAKKMNLKELIGFDKFDYLFRETWKLKSITNDGVSSGTSIFNALVTSEYPILYWADQAEKNNNRLLFSSSDKKGEHDSKKEINKTKYWAYDMGELFNLEKAPIWGVDICLIYPGRNKSISRVSRSISNINESFKQTLDFSKDGFSGIDNKKESSSFFKNVQNGDMDKIRQNYVDFLSYITMDIAKSMKETFSQESDASYLKFFNSLNIYDSLIHFFNSSSELLDMVCDYIKGKFKNDVNTLGIATKVCGLGKGGDILLSTQYSGGLYNSIHQLQEEIVNHTKTECFIDYLSWEDGFGKEGMLIEQFTDEGLYSQFMSRDAVRILKLDANGNMSSHTISKEKFEEETKKTDLLLDVVKNDIFIRGKAMSSKELFSARYTVEFLYTLLRREGKEVSNKELPRSSYSTNRNEFQGKILLPLQKEIKKRSDKDFVISISGTSDDFKLKLKATNCSICFLEKVF